MVFDQVLPAQLQHGKKWPTFQWTYWFFDYSKLTVNMYSHAREFYTRLSYIQTDVSDWKNKDSFPINFLSIDFLSILNDHGFSRFEK